MIYRESLILHSHPSPPPSRGKEEEVPQFLMAGSIGMKFFPLAEQPEKQMYEREKALIIPLNPP
jgi:hypothetical protein